MMGEASSEAVAAMHQEGGEDGGAGAAAAGGSWVSGSAAGSPASSGIGTASSRWSSSLFSSTTTWSVGDEEEDGDDGATSRPAAPDRRRQFSSFSSLSSLSSTSSESEALQTNGEAAAGGGPLYGMSTMRDHLPPSRSSRTGLSKYYQGRSESFTSLADVSCVEDLAKKTAPYIRRRPKASRNHAAALGVKNRLSKTIAKKEPRGRKQAASECQGKKELYRC